MKKLISLIMIFQIFTLFQYSVPVSAENLAEGAFNSRVSWCISGDGTTLTVSGTGEMGDAIPSFAANDELKSKIDTLIIEEGVTSVGKSSFSSIRTLKHVKLPSTLEYIDMNAFAYCYNIYDINIPDSVYYIGNNAFLGAYFLSKINDEFIILGNGNFYLYKGTSTDIIIPDNVKSISDRIFAAKKTIKSVYIPEGVNRIGENAFLDCTNLQYAVVPASLNVIENMAFGYKLTPKPVIDTNFTLYCYPSTTASLYAYSTGVNSAFIFDVDGDEIITANDALMILQNVTGSCKFSSQQIIQADKDRDGQITSYDSLFALNYIVGNNGE